MVSLSNLQIDSALSYAVAFAFPALDAVFPLIPSETAIDRIVASCGGDIRSALKALLLVNEHLEAELQQLYAAVALGGPFERGDSVLH